MIEKCRLCKSKKLHSHYEIDEENILYKCENCKLLQLITLGKNELDDTANNESIKQDIKRKTSKKDMEMNEKEDFPEIMKNLAHVLNQDRKRIRNVVEKLIDSNEKNTLIDIGSGYGHISFEIGNNNPNLDVHLLETSKDRMEMGIDTFKPDKQKFNFHHNLLDQHFSAKYLESFDVSLCFHVLEHVYDPVDFIKNMFSITKSRGFMVIEVPNDDDDLIKLSSYYKKIISVPAHVSCWTKDTLLLLVEKADIVDKVAVEFLPVQRYGFFNYIDWLRHNDKDLVLSDDYTPREELSWIEKLWLDTKKKNFSTDSIMMLIKKN